MLWCRQAMADTHLRVIRILMGLETLISGSSELILLATHCGTRRMGEAIGDVAVALVLTKDGGFAVAGRTLSFGAGNWDFRLVKIDASGDVQGDQTYGGIYEDTP